jgi:alpha-D-xyloside xylohydrolase
MRFNPSIAKFSLAALPAILSAGLMAQTDAAPKPITVEQDAAGAVLHNGDETLHLSVCGPGLIHVVAGPGDPKSASPAEPWLLHPDSCKGAQFDFSKTEKAAIVATSQLTVDINLKDGSLIFKDHAGKTLLAENGDSPRRYVADVINGEKVYHVKDRFSPMATEGLYGLGQYQNGVFNYRGTVLEMAQNNSNIAVPLMLSNRGYGLFWNTASESYFDNRFASELSFVTNAADAIDYYFIYGPEVDQVVHQYRELTGHAPLFGKWAYGFIQSKDRYKSAQQLLDIAGEYRSQKVPLDFIVQDWYWWKLQGDPEYSEEYLKPYPDVPGAIQKLHDENIHAMISIWAVTDRRSNTYQYLKAHDLLIPGTSDYDATNPAGRDAYWNLLAGKKFAEGWDGFWLDSSEPEIAYKYGGQGDAELNNRKLFIGNGARYTNLFPLLHTGGVYDHWRQTTEKKRVFLLTRSAFAGEQRNAAVAWSGDVYGTFLTFQRQIPAGLNYALSGMPYWTTDIAGYGPPYARDTRDPSYQELYTRWYEYGVFCPIFRTHGHRENDTNEIFSYGPQVPTLIAYDKLRYRLIPYIYSLAWKVTDGDYTIQRPLIMDFRTDDKVENIGDQFMFGPALLVNPVSEEGATSRELYLPQTTWYDFWTGEKLDGGKRIQADAPLNKIPLYVRAGSILPLGPEVQYATQKPASPIELRVYPGADGSFTLYDDAGDTYDYEKGAHATVPIKWDDAAKTLSFGAREGTFPGMEKSVVFRVIVVGPNHGAGQQVATAGDKDVQYDGSAMSVSLK